MERVKIFVGEQPHRNAFGIFAQEMMRNNPLLPVEEDCLGDPGLCENVIRRVYVVYFWH